VTTTEVLICTTCRPAGTSRDLPAAGQVLWDAVNAATAARPLHPGILLRGFACLNSCSRACTVAFQAAGKHSYCFGDLDPGASTAAQVLACALQHAHSSDGNLPRHERPERLRGGILLRLPPLVVQGSCHGADDSESITPAVVTAPLG
jgi:predicted metal-binding protein